MIAKATTLASLLILTAVAAPVLAVQWDTSGNAGTDDTTDFLGTTDGEGLVIKVNDVHAGRFEPAGTPRTIFGFEGNDQTSGIGGALVGGGLSGTPNTVTDNFGVIVGGRGNQAGDAAGTVIDASFATVVGGFNNKATGQLSTVLGGQLNQANGDASLAAGQAAVADHDGAIVFADASTTDAFASTGADQFLIRASGGVGINTAAPTEALHVGGNMRVGEAQWLDASDDRIISFGDEDCGGPCVFIGEVGADDRMTFQAIAYVFDTGNVGIGRVADTNRLEVEGDASKASPGDWLANSDARIKTDVEPLDGAVETLDRLRPVAYRYTDAYLDAHPGLEDRVYYNFIAQEYAEVFPDDVRRGADGLLQMDGHAADVYSVAAIQELHDTVQEQQETIADLEERLAALEAALQLNSGGT